MTQLDVLEHVRPVTRLGSPIRVTAGERPLIHIVDADPTARSVLALWFESAGMDVQTFAAFEEAFVQKRRTGAQCLVIDLQALRDAGFGPFAETWPREMCFPLIVTALEPDIAAAVSAMKIGAADFVEKPLREIEIIAAVSAAIELDRRRVRNEARARAVRESFATLSRREQQVMALVTTGRLNKQVGGTLGVSEITVKAHRGSAMRKMHAQTFAELVRMAELLEEELSPLRNGC